MTRSGWTRAAGAAVAIGAVLGFAGGGASASRIGEAVTPPVAGFAARTAARPLALPALANAGRLLGRPYSHAAAQPALARAAAALGRLAERGGLGIAARRADQGYADATGDNEGLAPDLRAMEVVDDASGAVAFGISYANRTCVGPGDIVVVFLDVDRNRATGAPGVGADYALAIDGTSNTVAAVRWTGSTFELVPAPSLRGRCLSSETPPFDAIVVDRADVGIGSSFDFVVVAAYSSGDQSYHDVAGPFTYELGLGGGSPPPPPPPAPSPPPPPTGGPSPAGPAPTAWCGDPATAAHDRPDTVAGQQVHVIYAVPSDGVDRFSQLVLPIADDFAAVDSWWYREANRAPRWDLFDAASCGSVFGRLDVSHVRLSLPSSGLFAMGPDELAAMTRDLQAQGFASPTKKYVAYYDGPVAPDVDFCGISPSPPGNVGGTISFVVLQVSPAPAACGTVGSNDYMALTAAHELLHNLGAVPPGAPHRCPDTGHICGDPYDIMSTGNAGEQYDSLAGARLDPGNDDYYGHSGSWWDVQDSLWLATNPASATPAPAPAPRTPPAIKRHLTVGSLVAAPGRPHAGHVFRLTLQARWDGVGKPQMTCHAAIDHRSLRIFASGWRPQIACTWRVPEKSGGKRFDARVRVRIGNGAWTERDAHFRVAA